MCVLRSTNFFVKCFIINTSLYFTNNGRKTLSLTVAERCITKDVVGCAKLDTKKTARLY